MAKQKHMDLLNVPASPTEFKMSGKYLRKELHNQFKGQRQHGISTPAAHSFVFLFTDLETEEYGYSDQFLGNGIFVYSGEGQQGDMTMDGGNRRILKHEENGDSLYVFERVDQANGADVVAFDGEYEYIDHHWEKAPDDNGIMREALRFRLAPIGRVEADINKDRADQLSPGELFQEARENVGGSSSSKQSSSTGGSAGGISYPRSELVRDCALRAADGVCQGCDNEAPFVGKDGEPFLEVHHMHRRSDGGLDMPENVIAICPNCHRQVYYGKTGDELNEQLIQKAAARNRRFS